MNKTRPNKVIFRMSDQELELLNQRVDESGMTRQDWILSVATPYLNDGNVMNNDDSLLWRVDKKTMDVYSNIFNLGYNEIQGNRTSKGTRFPGR